MPKKPRASESAYGQVFLYDLTDTQVAAWNVRAVQGETRVFPSRHPPPSAASTPAPESGIARIVDASTDATRVIGLRCRACDIKQFESLEEQYTHFKSAWHLANVKAKASGNVVRTLEEFEQRGDEEKDESASDSSSEDEEDAAVVTTQQPVVEFTDGQSVFKVFKNIMPDAQEETFDPYVSLDALRASSFTWAVLLLRSGRFAGAIFDKDRAVVHKAFQRYTTRRKQGGSQAASDSSGSRAKSAGATLRRYNEAALKQDVADLLGQWKELLQSVDLIFISSGKNDRATFFSTNSNSKAATLQSNDPRLRRIPFITFRPTFEEVCRVRAELCSVKFSPLPVSSSPESKKLTAESIESPRQTGDASAEQTHAIEEEEVAIVVPQLIALTLSDDLNGLKSSITETDVNEVDQEFMTPLHHAASRNSISIIQYLLDHGANPSLLDVRDRPPYFLCTTKESRNVFRRFMAANPDAWDYSTSQISSALTDEMAQKRKEKEAEKRRRARERKKQQKQQAAEERAREEAAQAEEEREIAAGLACDFCGKYAGKSPFMRLDFKYCSTDCVNNHRRKLMSDAAMKRFGG